MKIAANGNHYLVLTEGQRDEKTGEVRKKRVNVFSEDFEEFFNLLREAARFVRANPVPESVRRKQAALWKKRGQTRANVRAAPTLNQRPQLPPTASHPSAQQ